MSLETFSLKDKVAIVTGAGRNIGRAIALGLAGAGADVVVCARTAAEVEETARLARALGRKALGVPTDARSSEQVASLIQKTLADFGKIDILAAVAGGVFRAKALEMSERAFEALVRENLTSAFICSQAVAKVMVSQKRQGSIILLASVAGMGPYPPNAAYGASKAAIANLTRTLAAEWGPYGVRVNAIAPGMIVHAQSVGFFGIDQPQVKADFLGRIALGRFGKPEDLVGVAIYLASDASAYMTGATVVVDGGLVGPAG